jgi:competence protein ComEA
MLLGFLLSGCGQQTDGYLDITQSATEPASESVGENTAVAKEGEPILVYVCGEVNSPGVYELTSDMRICDAVDAAGGFTDSASREYWNLAEHLTDGQMLYFPTEEEAQDRKQSAEGTSSDSGGVSDSLININTADATQLMELPGIGQTRAEAILSYRREHGDFESIEDIMKVSGIKNALFEKIKDYITIR